MKADKSFFNELRIEVKKTFSSQKMSSSSPVEQEIEGLDIVKVMQDINSGKIRYLNVDWETQLKYMLKLCSQMTTKMPYIIWLWGFLSIVEDPIKRIDILGKLQDAASKCFDSAVEAERFRKDCACICDICLKVQGFNMQGAKIVHTWTDERKSLNDLAHILSNEAINPECMVALADDLYHMVQNKEHENLLTCVLRAFHPIEKLRISNIVDFAKNLYIAEGFRQFILSGKIDYMDIPVLNVFEPKLLKACFEEYIQLRYPYIKDSIERDLTHYGDAEDLECLEKLLEEENKYIHNENCIEEFYRSAAYKAMWYPGKVQVLNMINAFSKYLNNKINKTKDKAEANKTINFNAPVGQVITNVEKMVTKDE